MRHATERARHRALCRNRRAVGATNEVNRLEAISMGLVGKPADRAVGGVTGAATAQPEIPAMGHDGSLDAGYSTWHSTMPADQSGFSWTSIRNALARTGSNVTSL